MNRNYRTLLIVLAILVPAGLLVLLRERAGFSGAAPGREMASWTIPELSDHLRARGVDLRLVATNRSGDVTSNAFLTRTTRGRADLGMLPKSREYLARWQGTVYCERPHDPLDREAINLHWQGCCLLVGPFLFFGDPQLLQQIRQALAREDR